MLDLETQAKEAIAELFATGKVKPGSVVVIGCSTSEIAGKHIGKGSVPEIAGRIVGVLMEEISAHGCYLAAQCCEHLNRALVVEESTAERFGFEEVCVRPRPKAGGSFATAVYESMEHPVVVEHVKAKAGLDIGNTMIGMHMCDVAVPLRLEHNKIGEAAVNAAYSRPKLIGGVRADYPD